jgi:hypothetical protein
VSDPREILADGYMHHAPIGDRTFDVFNPAG